MVVDPLNPLDQGDARQHERRAHCRDGDVRAFSGQMLPDQQDHDEADGRDQRDEHVAVDQQHDGQADAHLGGGDRDDEQSEHLARDLLRERGERNEVDIDGVEHQLDRQQHEDAVTAGQHAVDAGAEQERAEDEILVQRHGQSLRAMTTAPTSAASSSIETTSKGTTKLRKIESATGPVRLTRNSWSDSLISSWPNAFTSNAIRTPKRKMATTAAGQR